MIFIATPQAHVEEFLLQEATSLLYQCHLSKLKSRCKMEATKSSFRFVMALILAGTTIGERRVACGDVGPSLVAMLLL